MQDFQQAPVMTESLTHHTDPTLEEMQKIHWSVTHPYLGIKIRNFYKFQLKITKKKHAKAVKKLQQATVNVSVEYERQQKAADKMDQTVNQMNKTCEIACSPSATEEDKKVASAAFNKYNEASAYHTEASNKFKTALNRHDHAHTKYEQAIKNMKHASENMKVVNQRFLGEDTESDSSDSDAP